MRAYHTTKAPEPTLDSVLWRYGARLRARRHSVERRSRGVRPRDGLGRGEGQVQVLVDDEEEAAVRGQRLDRGDDRVRRALHLKVLEEDVGLEVTERLVDNIFLTCGPAIGDCGKAEPAAGAGRRSAPSAADSAGPRMLVLRGRIAQPQATSVSVPLRLE